MQSIKKRLYVDSIPVGTQAALDVEGEEHWQPVNHTSHGWTITEAVYNETERERNGIVTGFHMKKMHTLGTHVEVVTDHAPFLSTYNSSSKPKQYRVNNHKNELLLFQYHIIHKPSRLTSCDYGSRHTPKQKFTQSEVASWYISLSIVY